MSDTLRTRTGFAFSAMACNLLKLLAEREGLSMTSELEMLIRHEARRTGILPEMPCAIVLAEEV